MLTTYGTAGSQTSYPSFMPGASDKVLKGADITGISFPLSHVSAFAMGTFLVDPADILVCPRNEWLRDTEVRPVSSGTLPEV